MLHPNKLFFVFSRKLVRVPTYTEITKEKCFYFKSQNIRILIFLFVIFIYQNQASRGVLLKRCSENMQQIYKKTPMPKCDFNKVAWQLY